jgi:Tol biopolymer transport system component/CubicO group peptidase (beta-lactamase class C family)
MTAFRGIALTSLVLLAPGCTGSSHPAPTRAPPATIETGPAGIDPGLAADLQRTLDQERSAQGFPGVSAAVVLPDGSLWTGASGVADVATRRPVTPHTIFAIASMSKAFVSVLATQLVAEGVLSLTDRLAHWVPEFPNAEHITILQLLTGTSGITDDNEHPFTAVDDDPSRRWTLQEFLDRVPPPVCPPGSCNSGFENAPFVLLGAVIERATGSSLAELYRERFFRPLGLDEIFLQSEQAVRGDIASGYQDDGSGGLLKEEGPPGPLTTSRATSAGGAAASMAASAQDVALWARAVFAGSLLDPNARSMITDFRNLRGLAGSYRCTPIGIAFGVGSFDGRWVRRANGGIPGFGSALASFPHEGLTVVALGNHTPLDGHDPTQIQEIRDALARTTLAYLSPPPPERVCNVDVYSVSVGGTALERLTTDPFIDGLPSWSPTGARILFGSNREGDFEVYVMDADGSGQTNLTRCLGSDDGGSWSPDGRRIAFPSDRDGDHEIYVMDPDGSRVRQLTRNGVEDSGPAWSPDGRRIAFTRESQGLNDIYVMNANGSGMRRLTRDAGVVSGPTWSPDGTRIAFEAGNPRYFYSRRIFTMKADGSDLTTLIADPAGDHQPAWGPNGLIAFSSGGDIFAIRPNGTGRVRITSGWPQDVAPAWSPDGMWIAFASERRVAVG